MFDESYCAGMALGPPQVSIDGLNELAVVLKLLGAKRVSGARSRPSMKREKGRAEKSQYREPMQLGLDRGRRIPQNPLGANPTGLIRRSPICCWKRRASRPFRCQEVTMSIKITPDHLSRTAGIYVRQSTMSQVMGTLSRSTPRKRWAVRRAYG